MEKKSKRAGRICFIFLCMGMLLGCESGKRIQGMPEEQQSVQVSLGEDGPEASGKDQEVNAKGQEAETVEPAIEEKKYYPEIPEEKDNREKFFEMADSQGVDYGLAEEFFQRLADDQVFSDDDIELTELVINDIDGNGQMDMLVIINIKPLDNEGGLWIYLNEDDPYYFTDGMFPAYGRFDIFWEDIDEDKNVEIVCSVQATLLDGDCYNVVFKCKNHTIEKLELPYDFEEGRVSGFEVDLIKTPGTDSCSADCSYFNEQIFFWGRVFEEEEYSDASQCIGGNIGGFHGLRIAQYDGKKVLQASEYLYGQDGNISYDAEAEFLITWEEDGTPMAIKWWIEEIGHGHHCDHEIPICFWGGYYYYASQADHGYLYCAKEDGSDPRCLAEVQAENICVQDNEIYFINRSEGNGIYRLKTDGTSIEKLCGRGKSLHISAEYVYFCAAYEAEYDKYGMGTAEFSRDDEDCLYRMKKDGSGRELIATNIWQYTLDDERRAEVWYAGFIYCCRRVENEFAISRMDLNGQNEEKLCCFDTSGKMLMNGYARGFYGDGEKINRFGLEGRELTSFTIPPYIDYCIYGGNSLYSLSVQKEGNKYKMSIYQMDFNGRDCKVIYQDLSEYDYLQEDYMPELYATGEGLFLRRFVSEREGFQWFELTRDFETREWKAEAWEKAVPKTRQT